MALVFSPLSEDILLSSPRSLYPRSAFVMRQMGHPPLLDERMWAIVDEIFDQRGILTKDADASTGGKDFLERILSLIRGTGFTVAVFSQDTRASAMANISLELGFASMCGKPLVIVKSKEAAAPSDLTRTDWIDYDAADEVRFRSKLNQALDELGEVAAFHDALLGIAMEAPSMDCAIAFERANKAFLLMGEERFLTNAEQISHRLEAIGDVGDIDDLGRLRDEIQMFIRLGRRALAQGDNRPGLPRR